ncbi:MAG: LacI family transcriptional regulator [Acidimicrobiia bacterium]|nr:LacI family transcriptional regulator [Acidimicrobiia bacterium]
MARRAGVSKSLVSMVMRGATNVSDERRARVIAAAEELGYRPNAAAQSLVRQKSFVMGVIVSDLHNTFFADVIDGIDNAVRSVGYRALLVSGHLNADRETEALETLLRLRADAVILAGPAVDIDDVVAAAASVPLVVAGAVSSHAAIPSVTTDDLRGAALAVDHLVELGHKKISHIDGGDALSSRLRRQGYEAAMRRHGLEPRVVSGSFTRDGGIHGAQTLLAGDDEPTAIFAANDLAAMGVLSVLHDSGADVPGELSVVGYDNTAVAQSSPIPLTTIDQPRTELGEVAARLALERINDGTDVQSVVLEPTLVIRDTTVTPTHSRQ